jgi:hypothetical protein
MEKFKKKQEADEKRIADLEYALSIQVGLHRPEVQGLEKKLNEVTENFNVEQAKREISNSRRLRVQKNVEELHQEKEECYNVATECCNKLKNSFAKVGAFSMEHNFIRGDPNGVIRWIGGEAEAFDEILSDRGDFCAFAGALQQLLLGEGLLVLGECLLILKPFSNCSYAPFGSLELNSILIIVIYAYIN